MDDRFQASDTVVEREVGVTITFADGYIASFDLLTLRHGCPCATCRNLRDRGEVVWPRPGSPEPLRIADARLHGAWGLNITWNDGHDTGIFPFESLRRWHEGDASTERSGLNRNSWGDWPIASHRSPSWNARAHDLQEVGQEARATRSVATSVRTNVSRADHKTFVELSTR